MAEEDERHMHKKILSWITIAAFSFSSFGTTAFAQQVPPELITYPELIVHNANVLTLDAKDTVAQAVAIRDGKFLAVGTNAAIMRLAGPKTQKIDAKGQTVMPGIVNTHIHPNRSVMSRVLRAVPAGSADHASSERPTHEAARQGGCAGADRQRRSGREGCVGQDWRATNRSGPARAPHCGSRRRPFPTSRSSSRSPAGGASSTARRSPS